MALPARRAPPFTMIGPTAATCSRFGGFEAGVGTVAGGDCAVPVRFFAFLFACESASRVPPQRRESTPRRSAPYVGAAVRGPS
jgi:hypothetical protein